MEVFKICKSVFESRPAQFVVGGVVIYWGLIQLVDLALVRMTG